ncbi:MAG: DinB family protein [Terriglobales bacterium]
MATKKRKPLKTSKQRATPKKAAPAGLKIIRPAQTSADQALRTHLLKLLNGGEAHADFDTAIGDWPVQLAGAKVANFPHTAWMLLEHMRIAQWDILEFSRNPKHVSPKWPEGYWPNEEAPADERAWTTAIAEFKKDVRAMEQLVGNRKSDLLAKFPWGDGQTLLREVLLLADHNSYHLGQLVMLRKCMGI